MTPALLLLTGCSSMTFDKSDHPFFADYVGKTSVLRVPQRLCQFEDDPNYRAYRVIKMQSTQTWCPVLISELSAGTAVTIQSVKHQWVPIMGGGWYALGKMSESNTEFEYLLGFETLRRAPWEEESAPAQRPAP